MKEKQLKLFRDKYKKEESCQNRHAIAIPLDALVLVSIIILFIVVISFSLGVKRGKESSNKLMVYKAKDTIVKKDNTIHLINGKDNKGKTIQDENKGQKEPRNNEKKEYIIQLASYSKENIAKREKEQLKNKGFSAEISKGSKYLVLYIGKFATKKEAEEARTSLKKRYSDCFIRRL